MLFLYRPRETWMPFALPRRDPDQAAYNRSLQDQFESTRRVPAPSPTSDVAAQLRELADLRASGALTEAEFETAKRRALGP